MEKIAVNNQIVSMRKIVKQSKLHNINKLVKSRKMLQLKKGTEEQLAKNKRKEERVGEEIQIIKKIPVDDVSRKSLMRLQDWKVVLSSKTASLEERSFALLAAFDPLQAEVKKFVEKNPRLVNLLPDFFVEWDAKKSDPMHQDAKRMKVLELKLKRKAFRAKLRGQRVKKNPQNQTSQNDPKPASNREKSNNRNAPPSFNQEVKSSAVESKLIDEDSGDKSADIESTLDEKAEILSPKKKKEIVIYPFDDLHSQEVSQSIDSPVSDDDLTENENDKKKIVKNDPFFVSANESFDEVANTDRNSPPTDDISNKDQPSNWKRSDRNNFKQGSSKFQRNQTYPRKNTQNFKNNFQQQSRNRGSKFDISQKKNFQAPNMRRNFSPKTRFEQNNRPTFFKGNKTDSASRKSFGGFEKKPVSFKKNEPSLDKKGGGLHPSWEAKRKLKEQSSKLVPFQGKKIKFDY